MKLAVGVWDHFERRPDIPIAEQYQQKIDLLREAERLGFFCYHLAEHHLSPLDLAPSPNVFLAALAQATHTLRLGAMVYILPLYHPVRLVQELCMLDHLSGGRLEVGIGRGIRSVEHAWFGISAEQSRQRSDEILDILVSAMSTGNLAFQGTYYQIPDAPMDLVPLQRPYPPLWYAGGIEFAGRHRLNFLTRTPDEVAHYWELLDQNAESPHLLNAHVETPLAGITKHLVIRDTDEQAVAVARRAWPAFQRNWHATSVRLSGGQVAQQNEDFDSVLAENSRLLVGSPRTVSTYLAACLERLATRPSFYFAPAVQWGDLTYQESEETLELFADQVMPIFAGLLHTS